MPYFGVTVTKRSCFDLLLNTVLIIIVFFSKDHIQQLLVIIIRNKVWFIMEYFTCRYLKPMLVTETPTVAEQGEVVANTIHSNHKEILTIHPTAACFSKKKLIK